jgi:hypothetical protein
MLMNRIKRKQAWRLCGAYFFQSETPVGGPDISQTPARPRGRKHARDVLHMLRRDGVRFGIWQDGEHVVDRFIAAGRAPLSASKCHISLLLKRKPHVQSLSSNAQADVARRGGGRRH